MNEQDVNTGTPSTIAALLSGAAQRYGARLAYVDGAREYSYADLDALSERFAAGLLGIGLRRSDRIGIIALNQIEWLIAYFAAARTGMVIVGLNVRYRDSELEFILDDSDARAVIALTRFGNLDYVEFFAATRARLPALEHLIWIGADAPLADGHRFEDLLPNNFDRVAISAARAAVRPDDGIMVIYTSGTTGQPKGAGLTQHSQLASALAQAAHTGVGPDDVVQVGLPLNHVGGITCSILAMMAGGGVCALLPAFSPAGWIDSALRYPPTMLTGVPTMQTLLLMQPRLAEVDLARIRLIISGGSNVEPSLLDQLHARMPNAALMNLYGLSESSGAIVMTPVGATYDDVLKSIGKPLPGAEFKVMERDGSAGAVGAIGELWFRGCGVIPGYVGKAMRASDAFDADGWLHTGDLGSVDARGYIYLMGRSKEMYIQGGFNVYPVEVENLLGKHPKVLMAAGIGVPDAVLGEIGRYYIVPRPGVAIEADELIAYCRAHLADYKVPRQIVLREALPMTPAGKIRKAALKEEGV